MCQKLTTKSIALLLIHCRQKATLGPKKITIQTANEFESYMVSGSQNSKANLNTHTSEKDSSIYRFYVINLIKSSLLHKHWFHHHILCLKNQFSLFYQHDIMPYEGQKYSFYVAYYKVVVNFGPVSLILTERLFTT